MRGRLFGRFPGRGDHGPPHGPLPQAEPLRRLNEGRQGEPGFTARKAGLAALEEEITTCRLCPRLVEWREKVAREKKAAYGDETYWGRPVPGFGDPGAGVVVLGLAPAAHGANRTGRFFTGDRSGDFLFASLYRTGLSDSPVSRRAGDATLRGLWISAVVRCAPPQNKPAPTERDRCLPYATRELSLLRAGVVVCLGAFAWDGALRLYGIRPKPKFGHGAEHRVPSGPALLGCYHPSQQNTFTGVLKPEMLDAVLLRARELAGYERTLPVS